MLLGDSHALVAEENGGALDRHARQQKLDGEERGVPSHHSITNDKIVMPSLEPKLMLPSSILVERLIGS